MNIDRRARNPIRTIYEIGKWLAAPLFFLTACSPSVSPDVTLRALMSFCEDPKNAQTCAYEEYGNIVEPFFTQWPHATILLTDDEFTVNGSKLWLPEADGNCNVPDPYDPRYYTIEPTDEMYIQTVADTDNNGSADPGLVTIPENDLTPVPTITIPQNGNPGPDSIVSLICAENLTVGQK